MNIYEQSASDTANAINEHKKVQELARKTLKDELVRCPGGSNSVPSAHWVKESKMVEGLCSECRYE